VESFKNVFYVLGVNSVEKQWQQFKDFLSVCSNLCMIWHVGQSDHMIDWQVRVKMQGYSIEDEDVF